MKKEIRNGVILLSIGIIASIGIILSQTNILASVSFSEYLKSKNVEYTNNSQSNVQGAIDDLYNKSKLSNRNNFIEAYTYNASTCVTGEESTCVVSTCYNDKTKGACNAGDIIKYKVRNSEIETFHVMYNDKDTITMQAQKNTVYNTAWITALDYSGSTSFAYDKGPLTILSALESTTAGWSNVKDITYTAGTTTFKTNAYTGCSEYNSCTTNAYTLSSRTAKARMITLQEAVLLGCTRSSSSCPKWMVNYLSTSTEYGGTVNDKSVANDGMASSCYWTMSANTELSNTTYRAWTIGHLGSIFNYYDVSNINVSARAVVVVSK